MMMLSVFCLLIGSMTCTLAQKGYVRGYRTPYPASLPSGYDSGAPHGGYGYGGYASSGSSSAGGASYDFVASSGDETPELVFSDVSDLEPVYAFSSRSRYQQGRAMYTKTRYTPGEPGPIGMLGSGANSETSNQNYPAKAPAKGGY